MNKGDNLYLVELINQINFKRRFAPLLLTSPIIGCASAEIEQDHLCTRLTRLFCDRTYSATAVTVVVAHAHEATVEVEVVWRCRSRSLQMCRWRRCSWCLSCRLPHDGRRCYRRNISCGSLAPTSRHWTGLQRRFRRLRTWSHRPEFGFQIGDEIFVALIKCDGMWDCFFR